MKDIAENMGENEKKEAVGKAREIASTLTADEIETIKSCAANAKSVRKLFSNPEFRKIIYRAVAWNGNV